MLLGQYVLDGELKLLQTPLFHAHREAGAHIGKRVHNRKKAAGISCGSVFSIFIVFNLFMCVVWRVVRVLTCAKLWHG